MNASCEIYRCDDGSILVEVFGDGWRLGLIADEKPKDCGWYTVGNTSDLDALGGLADGDRLFRVLDKLTPPPSAGAANDGGREG